MGNGNRLGQDIDIGSKRKSCFLFKTIANRRLLFAIVLNIFWTRGKIFQEAGDESEEDSGRNCISGDSYQVHIN